MNALAEKMTEFATRYHARADLVAEQRGWDCTIILLASDSGQRVTVRVDTARTSRRRD